MTQILLCIMFFSSVKPVLTDLSEGGIELRTAFDKAEGDVRMVLILSPGCRWCQEGAGVVQEKVLSKISSNRLKVFVVWLPMLGGDSRDVAVEATDLISDGRASHFWDSRKEIADAFGTIIGPSEAKQARLAWDFYAVFDASAMWKEAVPSPDDWMHQLDGVEPSRLLDGEKLRKSVEKLINANDD